jgi:hypothetical protein
MRRLDGDDLPLKDANAVGRATKTVSLRHISEDPRSAGLDLGSEDGAPRTGEKPGLDE